MRNNPAQLRPAPPFLIGAVLLVWGWQNSLLPYAVAMGLLLELSNRVRWRWHIGDRDFNRLTDLSGVLFFFAILYIFNEKGAGGIYVILAILPFVLFLLVLAQRYSLRGTIRLSSLFISLRRMERRRNMPLSAELDLGLPYCMLCLLSASAGNVRTIWFFVVCCFLLALVLWGLRPRRYRSSTWGILMITAMITAFAAQTGIREIQSIMERHFLGLFDQYMWRYRDPDRTTTAIGMIGRLKFSDRILVRIDTPEPLQEALYLREATYNTYGYGVWSAGSTKFTLIDPDIAGNNWTLNSGQPGQEATISTYMTREKGVVPLPLGTSKIGGDGIIEVNQNRYATVNMEFREGWISYQTGYEKLNVYDSQPDPDDLDVSSSNREDFERLAAELGLQDKAPEDVIRTVKDFFTRNFLYSITGRQRYPRGGYLHNFLFENRQGHCEYFATATVLLLRTAGIPARYAVGFSTREYSSLERQYIARSRHAHAWTMAWIGDRWRILDTTPANWAPQEDEMSPDFQPLLDIFAWLRYKYQTWRTGDLTDETETDSTDLLWFLAPLLLLLAWRLYRKERVVQPARMESNQPGILRPGMDSDFYSVVELMEKKGCERRPGETIARWVIRVIPAAGIRGMNQSLKLHYRYRFDPGSVDDQTRKTLRSLVAQVLAQLLKMSRS